MITKTIILSTDRLILRKVRKQDIKAMYVNWASDKEVTKYLNWKAHESISTTKAVVSMWLKQYDNDFFFQWGIEHKENGRLIGTISLFDYKNNSLEIGYCLEKSYWNQGIMSEACMRVIRFAFEDVNVKYLRAKHIDQNIASKKVLEKCGFKYVRTTVEYIPARSAYFNLLNYVLHKEDFR